MIIAHFIALLSLAGPTVGTAPGAAPDTTSLEVDLHSHPNLKGWLAVWSPNDAPLIASSFRHKSSWEIRERGIWVIADSGATYSSFPLEEARGWVFSPDSSYAVKFLPPVDEEGYPILEPDSDVQLLELDKGRWRVILQCGTPGSFEAADWIDTQTVLIGGGNWDELRPVLYRVNIPKGSADLYYGPQLPMERRSPIESGIQELWAEKYPWINWGEP